MKFRGKHCAAALSLAFTLGVSATMVLDTACGAGWAAAAPVVPAVDPRAMAMINKGDWAGAVARLETLPQSKTAGTNEQGWLAFGYLFLNKCKDLSELNDGAAKGSDPKMVKVVRAFDLTCQGKLEEAQKELESIPSAQLEKDPLTTFAMAAIAGKRGQAGKAVEYSQKTVDLAPGFAWGYRTLGYLQDRWLQDKPRAENSYERALSLQPNLHEVRDMLVDLKLVRNDFDGAVDVAQVGMKAGPKDARNHYRLAQIYIQQWRLREALGALDSAIAMNPSDARFHRSRASILRYQGKLSEAVAEQQRAVDLSKDRAFELVELANLNLLAGNVNKAAENLREVLKADPGSEMAHQRLIQLLKQEKRFEDLVAEYRRAIERKPKDAALHLELARTLHQMGKRDEAVAQFKEAANVDPENSAAHSELGALHVEEKDFPAAIKEYTRALNANPSSVKDLVSLGYSYAHNQDYMQAEAAFVTALALQQLSPGSSGGVSRTDLMRSLAALLLEEGRYADAAAQFEAVHASTRNTPAGAVDHLLLAQAKALRDRSESEAKGLVSAFQALPENEQAAHMPGVVDALLDIEQVDPAQELLSVARAEQLSGYELSLLKARAARLSGNQDAAKDLVSKLVPAADTEAAARAEAQLELAQIALKADDLATAETDIKKAIELDSKSNAAYELSARVYLKRGDVASALAAAKKALEINPYSAEAYLILGDAQAASKNMKEAAANYRKAVEVYPGLLPAHRSLLAAYRALALKDEIRKEEESIAQIEKRLLNRSQ